MDTPLVPTSMSGGQRKVMQGVLFLSLVFILVSLSLSLARGAEHHEPGFIMAAIALLGFILVTGVMLHHIRTGEAITEDKMKYVTVYQTLNVVFMCVCLITIVYGTPLPKKAILGEVCLKQGEFGFSGQLPTMGSPCWQKPGCFGVKGTCLVYSDAIKNYKCGTYTANKTTCVVPSSADEVWGN